MKLYPWIAAVICLLACVVSPSRAPAGETGCAPIADLHFVCGPHHPEDLVLIPGTQWILVSGMGGSLPGSPPGPGDLYLLNAADKRWHSIAQGSLAAVNRNAKLYGNCPAPDAAQFVSHGLAIRAGSNGRHTLYAINHGGRESVEVFAVDARGAVPRLTWTGCAHSRRVDSARGSTFILCELSRTDPRFHKYPRLPVLTCVGYQPAPESATKQSS